MDLEFSPLLILLIGPVEKINCCKKHCAELEEGPHNAKLKLLANYISKVTKKPENLKVLDIRNISEKAWKTKSTTDGVHWDDETKSAVGMRSIRSRQKRQIESSHYPTSTTEEDVKMDPSSPVS